MTDTNPSGQRPMVSRKVTAVLIVIAVILFSYIGVVYMLHSHNNAGPFYQVNYVSYAKAGNDSYNATVFLYNSDTGAPVGNAPVTFRTPTFVKIENTTTNGFANITVPDRGLNMYNQVAGLNFTYYNYIGSGEKYTLTGYVSAYYNQTNPYFTLGQTNIWNGNATKNGTMYYPRALLTVLASANETHRYNTVALQFDMGGLSDYRNISIYYKPLVNYSASNSNVLEGWGPAIYYFNDGNLSVAQPFPYAYNESGLAFLGTFHPFPMIPLNLSSILHHSNTTRFLFVAFTENGSELSWCVQQLYVYA